MRRPIQTPLLATAAAVLGLLALAPTASAVTRATTDFIAEFEGVCLTPCNDPVGYATIGHGHLIAYRAVNKSDRKRVWVANQKRPGRLTPGEAKRLLRKDLKSYEAAVLQRIKGVRVTAPMMTALTSFAFNLGPGYLDLKRSNGFTRQTNVAGKLRRGRYYKAARDMRIYDGVIQGGKRIVLAGLTRRRNDEFRLMVRGIRQLEKCGTRCTTPEPPDPVDPGNSGGLQPR
jgi:GH24 family phage-related lysozyme (muramidase)